MIGWHFHEHWARVVQVSGAGPQPSHNCYVYIVLRFAYIEAEFEGSGGFLRLFPLTTSYIRYNNIIHDLGVVSDRLGGDVAHHDMPRAYLAPRFSVQYDAKTATNTVRSCLDICRRDFTVACLRSDTRAAASYGRNSGRACHRCRTTYIVGS